MQNPDQLKIFNLKELDVPVIQLWQPWASWIMEGWKQIETRTHNKFAWMLNRTVAIHACKHWDKDAIEIARPYLTDDQINKTIEFKPIKGVIIGRAKVIKYGKLNKEHSNLALIDCEHTERYGLWLDEITKLRPKQFTGAQFQLYIKEVSLNAQEYYDC